MFRNEQSLLLLTWCNEFCFCTLDREQVLSPETGRALMETYVKSAPETPNLPLVTSNAINMPQEYDHIQAEDFLQLSDSENNENQDKRLTFKLVEAARPLKVVRQSWAQLWVVVEHWDQMHM